MVIVYKIATGGSTPYTPTGKAAKYTNRRVYFLTLGGRDRSAIKYTNRRVYFLTLGGRDRSAIWKFKTGTDIPKRTEWQKARDKYVNSKEEAKEEVIKYRKKHNKRSADVSSSSE